MNVNRETVIPMGDRVLVEWLPVEEKAGRIILTENTAQYTRLGRVIRCGEKVTLFKEGDVVLMDFYMGATVHSHELDLNKVILKLVGEEQILAKLEE